MKGRLIMALLLWVAVADNVWGYVGNGVGIVSCTPGEGYVYSSKTDIPYDEVSEWNDCSKNPSYAWGSGETVEDGSPYWIYAKPAQGYQFLGWKKYIEIDKVSDEAEFYSTNTKEKLIYYDNNSCGYKAVFEYKTKLVGVPRAFNVYVDNDKVKPNGNGNYNILEGKTVKISWSDDYQCGFSSEIPSANNATFTMPENDVTVVLNSLTISSGVTQIEEKAFYNCGLTDVYYEGTKAQWDAVEKGKDAFTSTIHWRCTATFNMKGHGTAPTAQTVYSGVANALTRPTDPTAEDYEFGGWYVDEACKKPFDFTAALSDNVTVYACWFQGSHYTLELPDIVEINPNTVWTPTTVMVSNLKLGQNTNGHTPTALRLVLNRGTLVNQADDTKTIPFFTYYNESEGNPPVSVLLNLNSNGAATFYIKVSSDDWDAAEPGTYSGTLPCQIFYFYKNTSFVTEELETRTIPVTLTIPPEPHTITTAVSPAEGGTVTGGGTYDKGTDVTLKATANEGYSFVNWTEDGNEVSTEATYTFTVSDDRSLVANFEQGYTINVAVDPKDGGMVTGGSSGFYADGTQLVIKAIPNEGYRFVDWKIDGVNGSSEPTYTFIVDGDLSTLVAHFEQVYRLSGTNVLFFSEGSINNITEAAEGERVTVSLNPVNVQNGYYLTGEFSTDGVVITKEEDNEDGWFIMPAKAVTVNAVAAERTEYKIDLTTATTQTITEGAWLALMQQEGYFGSVCDDTGYLQYIDLNLDGTPDLQLTDDYNEATRVTTYGVTKLDGANQLTTNYRLTIPTFPELNPSPYSTILVTLGSGSEVNNLPEIIMGDVNGDGRVTITDATLLTDFVNTGVEPAGFVKAAADVDYSRSITMADVMAILEIILTSFPTID